MTALTLEVEVDGAVRRVALEHRDEGYIVHMDGRSIPVDLCEPAPGVISLLIGDGAGDGFVGGRSYRCVRTVTTDEETIAVDAWQHRVAVNDPRSLRAQRKRPGSGNGTLQIKASMPGRVARVLVTPGETVVAHQGVVVIEAMKMQNELKSPKAGTVTEMRVVPGDTVTVGDVLAVID
jgi:biotin carboxyl carrier protein